MKYLKKFNEDAYGDGHIAAYNGHTLKDNPYKKGTEEYKDWKMGWEDDTKEDTYFQEIRKIHNKKIKTNEEFTSATGGNNGAILGGEVYNMPVSGNSTLTSNSIAVNTGSVNLNNASPTEVIPEEQEEEEQEEEQGENEPKLKKDKLAKKFIEIEEQEKQSIEEPKVMNWDDYLRSETEKIHKEL